MVSEQISSYTFLRSLKDSLPPSLANTPVKYMVHNSLFMGEKVVRPGIDSTKESGYQVVIIILNVLCVKTRKLTLTLIFRELDRRLLLWSILYTACFSITHSLYLL